MNIFLFLFLGTNLLATRVKATLQRDVLTYINVFRHMHASGPLLVDDVVQKAAENAANTYMKENSKDKVPIYRYSANFCKYTGPEATLDRTCVISWYITMKYFSWCYPKAEGQALPFVNMIWKASTRAGVGIAKGSGGTYFVVVYITLLDANNVRENVPPLKVVMEASDKADCPSGYSRLRTSCFKYVPTAVTWDEALVRCARENATLASIRNGEEEKFVRDLQRRAGSTVKTWIGLHDNLYEGRFKWFDGLKFKHGTCVPVNANGGRTENCVAWSVEKPEGCWEDRPCSEQIPYTCRTPVEGKSTYRTEILFKKFRWNPSYKDKNSKAYRDLLNGIRITFKEIFTRQSGQAKGGFRNATVKDVRAIAFQGRPAGLGISIKVQFRSFNADPTLRFQKFLRGSEKILSMDIDKPDKVRGKTGKAGDYCYNSCNHNKHTCAATHYLQSPSYGLYPGYPAPAPPPYSPNLYTLSYPATVQSMPTITDPYPSTCPIYCSQQSTMDCYTQCNDECCDNRNGKRKARPDRLAALKNTKGNLGKSPRLLKKQRQKEGVGNFHVPNGIREKWRDVNEDTETNLQTPGNSREHFTDNLNKTEGSEHWTFDEDNTIGHDKKYRKSFNDTRASRKKAEDRTEDMDPKLEKPYNRRGHFAINLNKTQSSKQSTIDEWDTMNDYLKYKKLLALRQKTDSRSTKAMPDHQQGKLKKEVETSQETHFNKLNTTSRANENERYTIILNKSAYDSRPSTFDGNGFNENSLKITKAYDTINDVLEHKKSKKAYLKPMSTGLSTMMNAAKKHKYFEKFNGRAESRDKHFGTLINSTQDSKSTFFPNKVKNNKDGYDHESTSRDDLINNVPEPNKSDQLSIKKPNVHSNINMGLIKQHKHLDENPPEATNEHFTTITNKTQESKVSSLDQENNNKYDHENEDPGDLINDVGDAEKSSRIHTLQQLNNLTAMFDDRPTEAANEHLTTTHLSDTRDSSFVKEHNNRYDDQNINADDLIDDEEQELKRSDASPLTLLTANSTNTTSASDDEEGESENESLINANTTSASDNEEGESENESLINANTTSASDDEEGESENESLINANTTTASDDEEGGESEKESLINALIAHSTNTSASDEEEEEEEGESDKGSLINALTTHSTNTTSASDQEEEENEKGSLVNGLKPMNDELENESLENDEDAISEKQEISRHEEDEKEKEDEDDESNSVREPTDENSETEEVLREPDDDNSESIDNDNAKDRDSDDQRNDGEHDEDEDEDDFYLDDSRKEPSEENLDEEGIQDVGIFGRRKRNKIFKRER